MWKVGLDLGYHLAQVLALNTENKEVLTHQWLLGKTPLENELLSFLKKLNSQPPIPISITAHQVQSVLETQSGASIGLIVTEGLEDWPHLRQPLVNKRLGISPKRQKAFIPRDMVFGISERINHNGEMIKTIDQEELNFLTSKFELIGLKQLAIGFLHSQSNPENEIKAKNYFESKGFQVICSHEVSSNTNEVARWWRTLLNAYVSPSFEELEASFEKVSKEIPIIPHFISSSGERTYKESKKYVSTAFGRTFSTSLNLQCPLVHFGLEEFYYVPEIKFTDLWQSPLGLVTLEKIDSTFFKIQPLQTINTGTMGLADFSSKTQRYEPGPMGFGRSLKPTFIDLLFLKGLLPENAILDSHFQENTKGRILDNLETLSLMAQEDFEYRGDIVDHLYNLATNMIETELATKISSSKIIVSGELGPVFKKILEKHFKEVQFSPLLHLENNIKLLEDQ